MKFKTIDDSHVKLNMEINGKVCTFLVIDNFNKITTKSMFYENVIKQQIKFVIFNTRICSFFTKYLHLYSYSKHVYL